MKFYINQEILMCVNKQDKVLIKLIELNNSQAGTPLYSSPEIWKNSHHDYKTDIWSLGCM